MQSEENILLPSDGGTLNAVKFTAMYLRNEKYGDPKFVEFVIAPEDCRPLKWVTRFGQ